MAQVTMANVGGRPATAAELLETLKRWVCNRLIRIIFSCREKNAVDIDHYSGS
jgi:hypothetical protein